MVDNDKELWESSFCGVTVYPPDALVHKIVYGKIVIAFAHVPATLLQLSALGVPAEAIKIPAKRTLRTEQFNDKSSRASAWRALSSVLDMLQPLTDRVLVEQGAALGFYRDGDFIPWDGDIDISLPSEVFSKQIEPNDLRKKLLTLSNIASCTAEKQGELWSLTAMTTNDLPICIFSRFADGNLSKSLLFFETVPLHLLYPPSHIQIRDRSLPLPRDCPGYFEHVYGKDWRVKKREFNFGDYQNDSEKASESSET